MDDELDLDGDGVADVRVPGLPGALAPAAGSDELQDTSPEEAIAAADLPPTTHPDSPMGQVEHMGYALRSETAQRGWRRKGVIGTLVVWLVGVVALVLFAAFE